MNLTFVLDEGPYCYVLSRLTTEKVIISTVSPGFNSTFRGFIGHMLAQYVQCNAAWHTLKAVMKVVFNE